MEDFIGGALRKEIKSLFFLFFSFGRAGYAVGVYAGDDKILAS